MKIYISGPITGTEDHKERFARAEEALRQAGHTPVNPEKVNAALPKETTHEEYMSMSYCMLDMCDCIFLLTGWRASKGANLEHGYATAMQMPIVFEVDR